MFIYHYDMRIIVSEGFYNKRNLCMYVFTGRTQGTHDVRIMTNIQCRVIE
jgi:hypothetical protein